MSRALVVAAAAALIPQCALAQPVAKSPSPADYVPPFRFVDVSTRVGIQPVVAAMGMGSGIAAEDFDDDGDIDLYVPTAEGFPKQLYRNRGDGTFEEIAALVGLDSMDSVRAALWLDYDGDRLLDLLTAGDCFMAPQSCGGATLRLMRQRPDGTFEDASQVSGIWPDRAINELHHRGCMAAGDLDGDGYLDLFIGLWIERARLLMNRGDGTFNDESGISGLGLRGQGHWQPVIHDFNGDGLQDIFSAIDFEANHLWQNDGDGTYTDIGPSAGVDRAWNSMGTAIGDVDNDGDLDLYVTEITGVDEWKHNLLFRNISSNGVVRFMDDALNAGAADSRWGWGCTFADLDNDRWLDIAVTNGFVYGEWVDDRTCLFRNDGRQVLKFTECGAAANLHDAYMGSGLLAADLDRDGDLDIVQSTEDAGVHIYENRCRATCDNRYIVIQPRMYGPNHRAIGAVVTVEVAGTTMTRLLTCGTSYFGQEPAEAFFGLGGAPFIDRVTIKWPDGTLSVYHNLPADHVYEVWD